MADFAIGVSKTALNSVVSRVNTAIKEEAKQWQTVERDLVFITGEFEMMQSFLNSADGERIIRDYVVKTWVRQVRDLSYDVEDCIEFVLNLDTKKREWWLRLLPSCCNVAAVARPVDEAVAEITQLKARVMDVSQRNIRYNLSVSDPAGFKPVSHQMQLQQAEVPAAAHPPIMAARSFGDAPSSNSGIPALAMVFDWQSKRLRVISVCGTSGDDDDDLGMRASVIRNLYKKASVRRRFERRAWVNLAHQQPSYNPHEFIRNLMAQFLTNNSSEPGKENEILGVQVMMKLEEIQARSSLVEEFVETVNRHRYFVVLEGLSSMQEWDSIKAYLPDRENGSRIIVSTHHVEIAKSCTGQPYAESVLRQSSPAHPTRIFYYYLPEKRQGATESLLGREVEADEILELIKKRRRVAIWGPPGVGKTALVRAVYNRLQEEGAGAGTAQDEGSAAGGFRLQAWANVPDPFDAARLAQEILFQSGIMNRKEAVAMNGYVVAAWRFMLRLRPGRTLLVIDGLRSKEEWQKIEANITCGMPSGCCVVVITADEGVATDCVQASDDAVVYRVNGLEAGAALRLFEATAAFHKDDGNLSAEECQVLSKCAGIPKFIVNLASHLAKQRRELERIKMVTSRPLNDHYLMHQLKNDPNFPYLKDLFAWLGSNFEASPQLIKKCIFYLSIFPQGSIIRRKRLVRRWIAEGYSSGSTISRNYSLEKEADKLIDKLINLGVMLACWQTTIPVSSDDAIISKRSCQVNSLFLDYIITSQTEEKTNFLPLEVTVLDSRCSLLLSTERVGQHLGIGSSWDRDEFVYRRFDFSRLRSLTVSGEWKPFFISPNMRVLRVLDLEDNLSVEECDLERIGELVPRLKLLSLRGCTQISQLPGSLGDLRHLQTLDIRHTSVKMLPRSIIKLQQLQCIRAGTSRWDCNVAEGLSPLRFIRTRRPLLDSCLPPEPTVIFALRVMLANLCLRLCRRRLVGTHSDGIGVPEGIAKLTPLQTLGVVNVNTRGGVPIYSELSKLTNLRKLSVSGLNPVDEFFYAIAGHSHLESLSVKVEWPPYRLQLPINLVKLSLHMSGSLIYPLPTLFYRGMTLQKLHTLRFFVYEIPGGEIGFESLDSCFPEIKILEIACRSSLHVRFAQGSMEKLEQLKVHCCSGKPLRLSGIAELPSLKHVCLKGSDNDMMREVKEDLEFQFAGDARKPAMKMEEQCWP